MRGCRRIFVGIILILLLLSLPVFAQTDTVEMKDWIDASLYRDMNIVIPENASPILQHSAEVFKKYWEMCTYRPITISNINQGILNIWLGAELCTKEWIDSEELNDLGDEGFIIRTYTPTRKYAQKGVAKQLLICGKTDLGTLHGVYTFFERYLNVSWLSSYYTHKPPLGYRLKEMKFRFVPHFEYRVFCSDLPEYKMEGERKEGLHLSLLLKESDFIPIPIYDCVQGEKFVQNTQELGTKLSDKNKTVCFISPETKNAFLHFFKKQMELNPERKFWTIDGSNLENACTCGECQELVKNTGTPLGLLLTMLDDVICQLERIYPEKDFRFCLSLKNKMRQVPQNIKMNDRVFIALSTETCDVACPIDDPDSVSNTCFFNDLKAWCGITSNILIQYYVGSNYFCGLFHQPELFNFQRNIQLFDRYRVRGIIICTSSQKIFPFSEFDALKSYILARLMWDPDLIIEEEINRFLDIYYGPAGALFSEFLNYQKDFVRRNNIKCSVYQRVPWWNKDYASKAGTIIQQAINMTYFSQDIYNRVLQTAIPFYYSSLICPPDIQIQEDKFTEIRPEAIQPGEFWSKLEKVESVLEKESHTPYREVIPTELYSRKFSERSLSFRMYSLENEIYKLGICDEQGAIVQIQNKLSGMEFLSAFKKGVYPYFLWNEYKDMSETGCGIPFEGNSILKEVDNDKIIIEREIKTGVLLQRKIRFGDSQDTLFEYFCVNKNSKDEKVSFYIIPCFSLCADDKKIELWLYDNQKWEKQKQKAMAYQPFPLQPETIYTEGISGIGIYFCDRGIFLEMEIQQLPLDCMKFFFDYSYYDEYISPLIKISLPVLSEQSVPFTLRFKTYNKDSIP